MALMNIWKNNGEIYKRNILGKQYLESLIRKGKATKAGYTREFVMLNNKTEFLQLVVRHDKNDRFDFYIDN